MKNLVLLVLVCSLSSASLVSAQSKQTQKEMFEGVYNTSKETVKSEQFEFVANVVFKGKKRESFKDNSNQIIINKNKVFGELETFSTDKTRYVFNDDNSKISASFDDENQDISITIQTKNNVISIEVKPNGNAFLMLSGNRSGDISYRGTLLKL
ncbi:MAG: DUF4251 domain-containing protein [Winogradskyella sp.]|uniref:hypothetical protein n=1 Tax=Winogradskyella sp. TaxID=1883156 RepID=UPI00385F1F81